ncbi:hypothetical protein INT43_000753 [Umbelopsis isabellina]|uniref:BZIP domain-containing protein n=1 Tax=Mortierella isabellina TaxID=91625 RepID=A0A8H7Q3G2_MORIS|nr:hypothetical protein INT43_000753 [Umbelopsis isabellina]
MSQSHPFESFLSSLNVEGQEANGLSEQELADELAIFANAQFTFDMPPGMGIQDDKPMPPEQHHRYSYQQQQNLVLGHVTKLKHDQQTFPAVYTGNNAYLPMTNDVSMKYPPSGLSPLLPRLASGEQQQQPAQLSVSTPTEEFENHMTSAPGSPVTSDSRNKSVEKPVQDDDKRRRNTAASARFRVKKKQREQALEHTAKEMTEKSERLEVRVKELELEIKWLRSLLLEKDARQSDKSDAVSKTDK